MRTRWLLLLALILILIGGAAWLLGGIALVERDPTLPPRTQEDRSADAKLGGRAGAKRPTDVAELGASVDPEADADAASGLGWLTLTGRLEGAWTLPAEMRVERDTWCAAPGSWWVRSMEVPSGGRRDFTIGVDGAFRCVKLLPGRYRLEIDRQRANPDSNPEVRYVELWQDVEDLVLPPTRRDGCTFRGVLALPPELSADRVSVDLSPGPDTLGLFGVGVRVSPDGAFTVHGLTPGPATLTVYCHMDGPDTDGSSGAGLCERRFDLVLEAPETVWRGTIRFGFRLRLAVDAPTPAKPVRGRLGLDAEGGASESWRVELGTDGALRRLEPSMFSAAEDVVEEQTEDGALVLPDVAPGAHTLTLDLPGFVPEPHPIHVEGPSTIRVPLRRQSGRWIRVETKAKVWWLDVRGGAPGSAWREVLWANERAPWRWQRHPEAAYLPEGRYRLRFRSVSHATTEWGPVEIRDASTKLQLRPPLEAGLALEGPVVAPDLRYLEGLCLYLFRECEDGDWARVEDKTGVVEEGRYAFRGLDPGRYRVAPTVDGTPVLMEADVLESNIARALVLGPR